MPSDRSHDAWGNPFEDNDHTGTISTVGTSTTRVDAAAAAAAADDDDDDDDEEDEEDDGNEEEDDGNEEEEDDDDEEEEEEGDDDTCERDNRGDMSPALLEKKGRHTAFAHEKQTRL